MALQNSTGRYAARAGRLRVVPDPVDDPSRPPERDADPESVARSICLRLLNDRAYTRAELAGKLAERGVPSIAAAAVLDRFSDVGLVDDQMFAASYVETSQRRRGLSRRALATELRRKGVADDEVAQAVATISDDDERARAHELVAKKLPSIRRLPPDKQTARLVGLLARKGYGGALAYEVVKEALGASGHWDADLAGTPP